MEQTTINRGDESKNPMKNKGFSEAKGEIGLDISKENKRGKKRRVNGGSFGEGKRDLKEKETLNQEIQKKNNR